MSEPAPKDHNGLVLYRLEQLEKLMSRHTEQLSELNIRITTILSNARPGEAPVCAVHERDLLEVKNRVEAMTNTVAAHDRKLYAVALALILVVNLTSALFGPSLRLMLGLDKAAKVILDDHKLLHP